MIDAGCTANTTGGPACTERGGGGRAWGRGGGRRASDEAPAGTVQGPPAAKRGSASGGHAERRGGTHVGVAVASVVVGRVHRRTPEHARARAGPVDVVPDATPRRRRPNIARVVA